MEGEFIMRRRTETTSSTILFATVIVAMTCCGVLMGLIQEWFGMCLHFLLVVYFAECFACILLNHKIESRFMRLAEFVTGKSESDRFVGKFTPTSDIILTLIFIAVIGLLLYLAGAYGRWLVLCVLLAVFLIGTYISTAVTIWLKFNACSKRLEELVSNSRVSEVHIEQGRSGL